MEEIKVAQIMTRDIIFVREDTICTEVQKIFDTHQIHHLPVLGDQGKLVGIISKLDYHMLLDQFTRFATPRSKKANANFLNALIAKEIMQKQVSTISPDESIGEAAKVFIENIFHCLPVVDGKTLIGIVTSHDLLKYYHEVARQRRLP